MSEKRFNAFHFVVKLHNRNYYPWKTDEANDLKFNTGVIDQDLQPLVQKFSKNIFGPFMPKKKTPSVMSL
jgi:hypothetical protein